APLPDDRRGAAAAHLRRGGADARALSRAPGPGALSPGGADRGGRRTRPPSVEPAPRCDPHQRHAHGGRQLRPRDAASGARARGEARAAPGGEPLRLSPPVCALPPAAPARSPGPRLRRPRRRRDRAPRRGDGWARLRALLPRPQHDMGLRASGTAPVVTGPIVRSSVHSANASHLLPYSSPRHPRVASRIEALRRRGIDPFSAYQLPQAAIALRQGFGRLVRSRSDRGIVAVLDRRIVTRGYGRIFLRTLPDVARLGRLDEVRAWWEAHEERSESNSSRISR